GILSSLVAIGFVIALYSTPDNGKNRSTRLWYLIGFAFASGLGLGPLMEYAILVNPTIIPTAFLSTCVIFGCFSLSAVFSDQRKWLYLGGTLMSFLSLLLMLSIINLFIGSQLLYQIHLYLAFFVVCGFIMYDTNLIIEKRRRGDTDYISHSVLLFLDFIDIFRYLLIILTQKCSLLYTANDMNLSTVEATSKIIILLEDLTLDDHLDEIDDKEFAIPAIDGPLPTIDSILNEAISAQIKSADTDRINGGKPTALTVSTLYVAIGTSHGFVLVFDLRQVMKSCLRTDSDLGSVSAMSIKRDNSRLLCGYSR
ncbi:unnamed protein product, partial [Medioppia subpectinata]